MTIFSGKGIVSHRFSGADRRTNESYFASTGNGNGFRGSISSRIAV